MSDKYAAFRKLIDQANKADIFAISFIDESNNVIDINHISKGNTQITINFFGDQCLQNDDFDLSDYEFGDTSKLAMRIYTHLDTGGKPYEFSVIAQNMDTVTFDGDAFYYLESDCHFQTKLQMFNLQKIS